MWAKYDRHPRFTIVELLIVIVIVVIGILAAITIIAYNGIQNRARVASIASSLALAAKKLALYQVDNLTYPTTLAAAGVTDTATTVYQYVATTSPNGYCVQATTSGVTEFVTNLFVDSQPGTCSLISGIVGWWRLNNDTNDSSGYGNHGTPINVAAATGQNNQASNAHSFDGISSQITVPTSTTLNPASAVTVSAWIYPANNAAIIKGIVGKDIGGTAATNNSYVLQLSTANLPTFATTMPSIRLRQLMPQQPCQSGHGRF